MKQEDELETDLDKWLYVLKHISKMDRIPVYLKKPIFEPCEASFMTKKS